MTPQPTPDPIAIIGLGPVGALLANLLGAAGARVVVYERAAEPHAAPRAAHLDDETMRILQAAGVADEVAASARAIDGMDIVDAAGRRLLRARKRRAAAGWPAATLVHQPLVEAVLRRGLARYANVEVRLGHELDRVSADDTGAMLYVVGEHGLYTERAGWVVGCDGARSVVRPALEAGFRPPGIRFAERWLVVDAILRAPAMLPDRVVHIADPRRPTTYVPFAGPRRRWEFRLKPGEESDTMTRPGVIAGLLRPHVDPALLEVERAAVYQFAGGIATRWRSGRLLLAGDAAHVMPPFIGQGLCAGLRDAAFLGWSLAAVSRGAAAETVLDAYERERRPHVVAAARLSTRVGRFVGMPHYAALLRDSVIGALRRWSAAARALDHLEAGAPRLNAAIAGSGGQPMRALPQPWVETPAGERLRLDDALGPGWAILGLALDPRDWAGPHPAWTEIGPRYLRVLAPGEAHHSARPALRDPAGALAGWAGRRGRSPLAIVMRPDRFVFGTYGAGGGPRAAGELARWLRAERGAADAISTGLHPAGGTAVAR